jgi:tetraacyldisaccharide 4'-kinase
MGLRERAEALLARHWWRATPSPLCQCLRPLAALYGLLARRLANHPSRQDLPVAVVVVGNLIVGGAGKTPSVIALVQALQAAGHRPGVISRGHGRRGTSVQEVVADSPAAEVGDEPLLIRRRTGVPVWVGRQRVAAARALCAAHPQVDVLVSDDGLQHRRLPRAAELLVFDERGVGNGLLLPAGPLRQPLPTQLLPHQRLLYNAPAASTPLAGPLALRGLGQCWEFGRWKRGQAPVAIEQLRGRPLLAVAGIAAPERFFTMLESASLSLQRLPLPDHYDYATLPWPAGTADVVTTEKDAVKLDASRLGATRVWVVGLDFRLPPHLFDDLLRLIAPEPTS